MSSLPPSFRLPFTFSEAVPEEIKNACRLLFQGLLNHDQAIVGLKGQGVGPTTPVTTVTPMVSGGGGGSSAPSTIGTVNLQPNPPASTAYTTAQSDFGGLIVVNSAVAFAYTLDSGLTTPFYVCVFNIGAGAVTATPSVGNVNSGASVRLLKNEFAIFFYDEANWWALITVSTVGLPVYANNAAAVAGGLLAGDLYRTNADPDFVAVVH